MKAAHLICKGCSATYPLDAQFACVACFGPLEVGYTELDAPVSRERIEQGPRTLWRYADFLPVAPPPVGLPVGLSPLIRADNLARGAGTRVRAVHQDRDVEPNPLVQGPGGGDRRRESGRARFRGARLRFDRQSCRRHRAAAAAALGLPSYIFVPNDLEREKIVSAAAYGATVFAVDGSYDDVNRLCSELAYERPWAFVNVNMRAYYSEGSKTIALETAEQLGWRAPDRVIAPIASGSLYTKILAGFEQGRAAGLIAPGPPPVMHGAQGLGCSPGGDRVCRRQRRCDSGATFGDCEVARDRQPCRRRVRARGGSQYRWHHRGRR